MIRSMEMEKKRGRGKETTMNFKRMGGVRNDELMIRRDRACEKSCINNIISN